jgi:site-specific DNA recombinase
MPKVALYARYSSDNQRDASIEDQLRLCRLYAERQGWTVADNYTDRAISGASLLLRPGIQELIHDALRGRFDIVLAEAMDRLSRDQEDIAGLFKRMRFVGVRLVTLSEGDVTPLHVGLKGTMNAVFLTDLADKTRRGQRGRVEKGKAGGGLCFGYDVVRAIGPDGQPVAGERHINQAEAEIVRRIFREYAAGRSSRTIALALNADGISGPQGRAWGPSTIHGNLARRNGILNNELYIGRLIWNRQRFLKDPDTGKRVARPNPESEWVIQDVPELRIVDDVLWKAVRERQAVLRIGPREAAPNPLATRRRPKHLFARLARCGRCGGSYTLISKDLLGCGTARNKGTCDNRVNIRRDALEASVLDGLRTHLMDPALFREFCEEFTREVNRLRMRESASLESARNEVAKIDRELDRLMKLILASDDVDSSKRVMRQMTEMEKRKEELEAKLSEAEEPPPLLHPSLAEIYREHLNSLSQALGRPDTREKAADVIRSLVSAIELTPQNGDLAIVLRGDLAAMLSFASNKKKPGAPTREAGFSESLLSQALSVAGTRSTRWLRGSDPQGSLVAGVGFEPTTFRL